MNHNFILVIILFFASGCGHAQKVEKVIVSTQDPHQLYLYEQNDTSSLFYLKIIPKSKPIGVLVIMPSSGELVEAVMQQITLHQLAVEKGLIVIFPSINWGSCTFNEEHKFLDIIFKQVATEYEIPRDKFVLGGLSGGGMVSLTYVEKAIREKGTTYVIPKAIFALDPPLDFAHLYLHAQQDVEKNNFPAAVNEGNWLMRMYETELGGTPQQVPEQYIRFSIYSHSERDGGNAKYLLNTPVRIYTEPAIEWQMKYRHRDFYNLNCTDISAMINLLQLNGNSNAEMIVTYDKGVRIDGTKHPHSWSIMDSKDCLDWILKQLN